MAKKRHHSSDKYEKRESSVSMMENVRYGKHMRGGMKRGTPGEGSYEGLESARNQERRDAMMIYEDHSAVANLPQQVIYKPWPSARHYTDYGLDDTISGIDHQENLDNRKMEEHLQPEKY